MSEAEYDRLLEAVRMAIEPAPQALPQEDFLVHLPMSEQPLKSANDNQPVWPLIPFPEGWYAAC